MLNILCIFYELQKQYWLLKCICFEQKKKKEETLDNNGI